MSQINVHNFDGRLNGIFNQTRKYSIIEKKQMFSNLINLLTNPSAKQTVNIIIKDLKGEENYQPENNLDSSDILVDLLQYVQNKDLLRNLNEQLADVHKLGMCASGRCTRLLQLWRAFIEKSE